MLHKLCKGHVKTTLVCAYEHVEYVANFKHHSRRWWSLAEFSGFAIFEEKKRKSILLMSFPKIVTQIVFFCSKLLPTEAFRFNRPILDVFKCYTWYTFLSWLISIYVDLKRMPITTSRYKSRIRDSNRSCRWQIVFQQFTFSSSFESQMDFLNLVHLCLSMLRCVWRRWRWRWRGRLQ